MSKVVKLGIVGAGRIALQHLRAIDRIKQMQVVGITSRTKAKAEQLAADFSIPAVGQDIESLIKEAKPDALLILVSAGAIFEVTMQALEYEMPLFIEKPAGLNLEESSALVSKAKHHGVRTMVGYNRRYYSNFSDGLEIIKRYGPLMGVKIEGHERIDMVRERSSHPTQVLDAWIYANATHTIDLLRFFGGEPEELSCVAAKYREPDGDQFAAVMTFASGAIGEYSAHWLSPGGWRVTLYGNGVTVDFKPLEGGVWTNSHGDSGAIELSQEDQELKPGFFGQMLAFHELAAGGEPGWPYQNLEQSHKTVEIAQILTSNVIDRSQGMQA